MRRRPSFMDHLRKGTYVIEYEVHVDRSGVYQAGTSAIRSVYAPELAVIRRIYIIYRINHVRAGIPVRTFLQISEVMEKINFQT